MLASESPTAAAAIAERRSIVLLIDVEPDFRRTRGDKEGWEGTRVALPYLAALRQQLAEATGIRVEFNWFLRADPQIAKSWGKASWVAEACPQLIDTIERHGDACGIHPHLWRWNARRREWFTELNDPDWTAECLQTSIEAFRDVFHRPPEV